ncbi:hypothetical protein ARMGADRAFT_1035925 [Armillaria gallica]|uniref:Transmembrane protein n=1 Tax=Armillaria gallica TaxID=47427 RepID=A0A2H3CSB9_ARMGA|nr:hypothetical protein ARMGADRAFT_1035925 [Armillaria gallica]
MTEVPDLSYADIQTIFKDIDAFFNSYVMGAFCEGIHTGIIAITMWTVLFSALNSFTPEVNRIKWVMGVSSAMSTLVADTSMIWRCWIVWEQHWFIILVPMLCLLAGTGRVAAGHSRPDESWEGSIFSSLHFGHHSEDQSQGTIDSDVEGGTGSSEEGQFLVSPADSSEQDQGAGGQKDDTGQITYVEIV